MNSDAGTARPAPIIETHAVGPLGCNCTIIADPTTREAIVIDPGDDAALLAERLDALRLRARYLVHTHAHLDHVGGFPALRERCGGEALLHPGDTALYATIPLQARMFGHPPPRLARFDGDLVDDEILRIGAITLRTIHTPGHTPGSVSFAVGEGEDTRLFTGDTLFRGAIGRWDLGGTSATDIVASIRGRLLVYPDITPIVPGHGPATTIGHERATNPFLR